ncbi:AAA family ATPase [Nocardioides sp. SYSU DS0651]|uniref:AAA family ATPase n=1 Tax=Nocardioides sp. SYSU DS0651 TaxID=3415955 RepID=UPI003F4BDF5F
MIVVLLVSQGAAWESRALGLLNEHPGIVVLKRCVDVADLVAAASTGQADVAVLGADVPGLDQAVVDRLAGHGVRTLVVATDRDGAERRPDRIGTVTVLPADRVDDVASVVAALPAASAGPADRAGAGPGPDPGPDPGPPPVPAHDGAGLAASPTEPAGRVIAVWGPGGAPGRTTLAAALAGELARRGLSTLLVDADPYGGAVAQQLGILDEVSGLLAAARLAAAGTLDERFGTVQRRLSDGLRVVTGLPRPDRWVEVRPGTLGEVVERGRRDGQVVVDTGFSLEGDAAADLGRPERNGMTREALEVADEIVLVGSADPVGLARLARAITEVHELLGDPSLRVVVNRMRPTLGWRETDVVAMLGGFGATLGVHFLPDDQAAVDRALVAGRLLVESGEGALTRGVAALLDAMAGAGGSRSGARR